MLAIAMSQTSSFKGPAFAIASALLFGASTPAAKALLGVVDPWLLAGLLYEGAGIGLLSYRLIVNHGRLAVNTSRADWPWLAQRGIEVSYETVR
jgi:hypothetical protein